MKREAVAEGLEVLQPEKPRGAEFLDSLRALSPEISVVAAYGEILTEDVLELPDRGSVNVHASLLPRLRGAAPVNWAIIRGHDRSGVTIMRMVRELDAGPVLMQREVAIPEGMTAGELFEVLAPLGGEVLVEALDRLASGDLQEREQDHRRATYAPKLDRETARLDWSLTAEELERWVRGLDPWPGGWSELDGGSVQLFSPEVEEEAHGQPPGTVLEADPRAGLLVAAGSGAVRIGEVKPAGSRRMSSAAWIRGRGVSRGDRFR